MRISAEMANSCVCRNTMSQERLNALAMLWIEKRLTHDIPDFNKAEINAFAHLTDGRDKSLYSTPHVIVYQLGDTCLLHEWLISYTNCTSFLYNLLYHIQQHSTSQSVHIGSHSQAKPNQNETTLYERNSKRNKELRRAYVDRVLEMDAHAIPHEFIFIDEAVFNLAKTRRRGRNVIGHRAIINVPGQRGGNITILICKSMHHQTVHLTLPHLESPVQLSLLLQQSINNDKSGTHFHIDLLKVFSSVAAVLTTVLQLLLMNLLPFWSLTISLKGYLIIYD
ncbi:hypothetical protein F2P81_013281 [Scophthalmus maximus]|uniref:Tc1-like transposase DDE domain-containing protein n=1 Tax=Scophthalmus maximus TaxID=52904 RepID=A0A6A4SNF8_SCOMX|nr:hypothetical protein F2P81_013281 [Scophthalmus maximus]